MGTWSITPNTLASIDNSGRATFQEHTSQVVYTITYTSDTCGTVTKQFTVYPCTQECTCSTTGGLTVPAEASETEVQVGTYSSSNCGGSWSTPTLRSGTDFLKDFRFADGKIYAKVKSTNTGGDARSAQYNTGIGTCTDYFTIHQSGTGACDCESSRFSVTGANVDASGGNAVLIGNFTSECEPSMSLENYAGDTFIDYSITSYTYDSSTKKGKIYAKVSQNTTSSERMEQPGVLIIGGTDFCKHFAVQQSAATPSTCDSYEIEIANTGITGVASGYTDYCPTLITLSGVGKTYCVKGSSRTVVEEKNISTAYTTSVNGDPAEKTSSITLAYDSTIASTSTSHTESFKVHTAPSSAWELHGAPATYNPTTREYEFYMLAYDGYQIYNPITFRLVCSDTVFVDREPSLGGVQKFNGWDFQVWHEGNTFYIKCTGEGTKTFGTKMLSFTLINGGFGTNATITALYG